MKSLLRPGRCAPRRTTFKVASSLVLAACGGDEKAAPAETTDTTGGDTAAEVATTTGGDTAAEVVTSAVEKLGLGTRVTSLSSASTADHCARLEQAADTLGGLLGDRAALAQAEAEKIHDRIASFAKEFGLYESLLFGEVHRIAEQALTDEVVSTIELRSVVRALDTYGRLAGVQGETRKALTVALTDVTLPATPGPAGERLAEAARKYRADLTVRVANFVTDLQRCAPITEE